MSTNDKTSPFPALNFPSEEEMRERSRARREAALAPFRDVTSGAFIGVSLGAWLEHARSAGVPYIPAAELARIDRETYLRSEETFDTQRAVWEQFAGALRAVPAGHMLRWDACAGWDLKSAMARGEGFGDHALQLHPDDPRAFDILYDYPADELRVWARPWTEAMQHEGYPVEYRAFVQDSKLLGIANYYPQRALPDTEQTRAQVQQVEQLTQRLVAHLDAAGKYPWMVNYQRHFKPHTVNATLDFLVTSDGVVLLLEAGPPFGAGAHPCSFLEQPISGLALGLAPGVKLR